MALAILLPTLTKVGILIDFKINQDFIAEVLCINRDEPILMCSGNCYLSSQLAATEEKEQQEVPQTLQEKVEVLAYCMEAVLGLFPAPVPVSRQPLIGYETSFYAFAFVTGIFHPPQHHLI